MTAGYCVHCGLLLPDYRRETRLHAQCAEPWAAEQARIASVPKSAMQQQLDRIEEQNEHLRLLIVAIINALPGTILFVDGKP